MGMIRNDEDLINVLEAMGSKTSGLSSSEREAVLKAIDRIGDLKRAISDILLIVNTVINKEAISDILLIGNTVINKED